MGLMNQAHSQVTTGTSVPIATPIGAVPDLTQTISSASSLEDFLVEFSLKKNFPLASLQEAFDDVTPQALAKKYVTPPTGARAKKNWLNYRQNALDANRVNAGKSFWQQHEQTLSTLEKSTGIPTEIVVGILGIETIYGKNMGSFPVRDVLVTLAFDYPDTPNRAAREQLFKNQLADLILFCAPSGQMTDMTAVKTCLKQPSSFAGAIGMPQFMPSSILKYAIDGNQDGMIDLRNSPADAMASIANFLLQHGWEVQQPILLPVASNAKALSAVQKIADGDPQPKWTLAQLHALHIIEKIPTNLQPNQLALIVDLPIIDSKGNDSVTYWVGLKNFEVITQYNRSFFYAMAVTEFGFKVGTVVNPTSPAPLNPFGVETLNSAIPGKRPSTSNDHPGHKRQKRS